MAADMEPLILVRGLYRQREFDKRYKFRTKKITFGERITTQCYCSKQRVFNFLTAFLPIIAVMRKYRWKEYILGDIMSGVTAGIMHIPQGMGYGILINLKPIYGLYTSFWPVLVYIVFGTGSHLSFGTNAVICLLVAAITGRKMESFQFEHPDFNSTSFLGNDTAIFDSLKEDAALQYRVGLSAATAFMAGVILLAMGILRLGFITLYLSDSFISGFTTGAAVHIATSQVPKMLAINIGSIQGVGKIIRTYIAVFSNITKASVPDFLIAIVCVIVLMFVKECINERFKSKMKMPIPIDLIVVIIASFVSHFGRLHDNFGVVIVNDIPAGFPTPSVPPLAEVGDFVVESFVIAILIFAMTIAMAKLLAKKHFYEIDDNQELVAYGLGNLFSSFLLCFPSCVGPPRSMLLSSLGGRTTFSGLFTAALLFLVIMLIGPLFASLPVSVLAAMIVVAMKGLFMQVLDLKLYWKVNVFDFISWLATFLAVVAIDIDIGLAVGVVVSAFTVVIQSQFARGYQLGKANDEDVITHVKNIQVSSIPGVKIFRFESSLYFATAELFRSRLYATTIDPKEILKKKKRTERNNFNNNRRINITEEPNSKLADHVNLAYLNALDNTDDIIEIKADQASTPTEPEVVHHVIIDCSPITYVDIAGIKMLQQIMAELKPVNITMFLTGCSPKITKSFAAAGFFESFPKDNCFVEIFDALRTAQCVDGEEAINTKI